MIFSRRASRRKIIIQPKVIIISGALMLLKFRATSSQLYDIFHASELPENGGRAFGTSPFSGAFT